MDFVTLFSMKYFGIDFLPTNFVDTNNSVVIHHMIDFYMTAIKNIVVGDQYSFITSSFVTSSSVIKVVALVLPSFSLFHKSHQD